MPFGTIFVTLNWAHNEPERSLLVRGGSIENLRLSLPSVMRAFSQQLLPVSCLAWAVIRLARAFKALPLPKFLILSLKSVEHIFHVGSTLFLPNELNAQVFTLAIFPLNICFILSALLPSLC